MKTFAFSLLFFAFIQNPLAQDLSQWNADTLKMADTAHGITYLTVEEKKIIQLMNLARLDGKSFLDRIAKPYVEKNDLDLDEHVESLYNDLMKTSNLPLLNPHHKLWESAAFHAHDTGHRGIFGHQSSDGTDHHTRIRRYHNGSKLTESLCYGYSDAIDIVMQLLFDEGIPEKNNRYNILAKDLHHVGLSIKPHKVYEHNCVIDFSAL